MDILAVDQQVLFWLNNLLVGKSAVLDNILVFFGVYLVYALPVIMLTLWFVYPKRRIPLALSFGACLIAWLLITKLAVPNLIWFRPRPDFGLIGLKEVFFHRPSYSFPSDHATALFAITIGLYVFNWRKAANYFLAYSIVILFARVIIGVHFPLDIIGGVVSGAIGVFLVYLTDGFWSDKVLKPIIKVLKRVYLA